MAVVMVDLLAGSERPTDCLLPPVAFYVHIRVVLQIFAALPVSTDAAERTVSTKKILKT